MENEMQSFYKSILTVYHVLGIIFVLMSSATLTKARNYFWPYVPSIPFQILVGPIKLAAILYPAVPQIPRLNRIKFFILHLICVEFLCGALVGTQVYYYCTREVQKCYEPEDLVNPREEDYTMADLSLQTIVTIYTCCIACLIKSVYRRAVYSIQKGYIWLEENSLSLLILTNALVIILDMDYNRSFFSYLVLSLLCDVAVVNNPDVVVGRRPADIWLEMRRRDLQARGEPNGWVINRYEVEPDEQPRAEGWFADRDERVAGEAPGNIQESNEEEHNNIQEMVEVQDERIHEEHGAQIPLQIRED